MADIAFVNAGVGGGKSLFGVKMCLNELANGRRMVVTNLAFYVDEAPEGCLTVGEWCHKYVEDPVDLHSRFLVLQDEWIREFYRYLPGLGEPMPWKQVGRERLPDLQWRVDKVKAGEIPNGCLFVIDEVHDFFRSRDWQKTGLEVEHYLSHMRKLNDDVLLITQHPEFVDKNFRRRATEWLVCQNMEKTRLYGGVTFKKRFRIHTFPLQPGRNEKPSETVSMRLLEDERCKTYDTMSGVGLVGRLAPEQKKQHGRHWSVWVVALAAILVLSFMLPRFFFNVSGRFAGGLFKSFSGGMQRAMVGAVRGGSVGNVTGLPGAGRARVVEGDKNVGLTFFKAGPAVPDVSSNVFVCGVATEGERGVVFLTDGTVVQGGDLRLHHVGSDYVEFDGLRYGWLKTGVNASSAAAVLRLSRRGMGF